MQRSRGENNPFADIYRELDELRREVSHLRQQLIRTTLPEYNPAALPADVPNLQIFIGTDNTLRFKRSGTIYNAGP